MDDSPIYRAYPPEEARLIAEAEAEKQHAWLAAQADIERAAFDHLLRAAESKVYRLDEVGALAARQVCYEQGHQFGGIMAGPAFRVPSRITIRPTEDYDCHRCDATITITYPELGVER